MNRIALTTIAAAVAAAVAAGAALAAPAGKFTGQELSGQAKISMSAAQAIALKARPGKVADRELEKEGGGSGLRYAFDIQSGGKTYEVGVDAATGAVLENGAESAAQERQEARQEKGGHEHGEGQEAGEDASR
jgi:uncharacterized membrane protein YkoI